MRGPLGYPIFWEALGGFVIIATYSLVAFISFTPARIYSWNLIQFVWAGGGLLSGATDDDRASFAEDILRPKNIERLISYARAWDRAEHHGIYVEFERLRSIGAEARITGRPPISAFYRFAHRRELEKATFAATFLQMISDHELCAVAVRRHPWPVAYVLRHISDRELYADAAKLFIQEIAAQSIIQDGSLLAKEIRVGGFSNVSLLSASLFEDLFILRTYNPMFGLQFDVPDNPSQRFCERLNSASKMMLQTAIKHHEFWPQGYMHQVDSVYEKLSRENAFSRFKGKQIDAAVRVHIGIRELSHTLIVALEKLDWRTQQGLFVVDPDPAHYRSDLVEVVVSIVFDSLEGIANGFKGFEDEAWSHAITIFTEIYPFHSTEPAGMNPLQQQLALKLLDKVKQNMQGWYPAITRVLLAVVGPHKTSPQVAGTAFALLRDAFYKEVQKLPELHSLKPDKLVDFLPQNVVYNPDENSLAHTYRGGEIVITKLSELKLPEIDLCKEDVWRKSEVQPTA